MTARSQTPPGLRGGVLHVPTLGRRPRVVVLTGVGSLGDLYPVLLLAQALMAQGIEARLALSPDHCLKARDWGLEAQPIGPSEAEVSDMLGMTRDEIAASILRDPGPLVDQLAIPSIAPVLPRLLEIAAGADCIAGTTLALAAPIAAEVRGVPFVPLVLQPLAMFAPEAPPKGFGPSVAAPRGRLALGWNRALMGVIRSGLRLRHGRALTAARAGAGLPPFSGAPLLDPGGPAPLRLGFWSERFAPAPPSAAGLHVVGFPPAPPGSLSRETELWLADGPPPLVVTLGSAAHRLGGPGFWSEAVTMSRGLGLRVVLLHGTAAPPPAAADILSLPYAPHSALFPHAAAIVHHGGMGTTAEALRAGVPQLVLPVGADQPDNAARLARLGVARVGRLNGFRGTQGATAMGPLLDRFDHGAAAKLADAIRVEDGAARGAALLADLIEVSRRKP